MTHVKTLLTYHREAEELGSDPGWNQGGVARTSLHELGLCEAGINDQAGAAGILASQRAEASRQKPRWALAASDKNSHPQQDGWVCFEIPLPLASPQVPGHKLLSGVSQLSREGVECS